MYDESAYVIDGPVPEDLPQTLATFGEWLTQQPQSRPWAWPRQEFEPIGPRDYEYSEQQRLRALERRAANLAKIRAESTQAA